jgi:hypothetical protein
VSFATGDKLACQSNNREFALVLSGDKTSVIWETEGPDGIPETRFLSVDAFKVMHGNQRIERRGKFVKLGNAWLEHPERRWYKGVAFHPGGLLASTIGEQFGGYYNLWKGFSVEPIEGDCSIFLDHVLVNICQGDRELFAWVIGWCANLVQNPARKED